MNVYVIVEGEQSAKDVYAAWIPMVNPSLSQIYRIDSFRSNNFFLFAGHGYPGYIDRISNAIEDINTYQQISRLVIAVDSEEKTFQEKLDEIKYVISHYRCTAQIMIIIQHFCLEAWALGNRKIMSRNIQNTKLREYKSFYDVYSNDPELLPAYPKEELNKAQFAYKYLIRLLNEKFEGLSYSKHNSKVLQKDHYFLQLNKRLNETKHIASFQTFLNAFI